MILQTQPDYEDIIYGASLVFGFLYALLKFLSMSKDITDRIAKMLENLQGVKK